MKFNQMTLCKLPLLLACLVLFAESIGLFILPAYIDQNLPSILCGKSGQLIDKYIINYQDSLSTIANHLYLFSLILLILAILCIWSLCSIKENNQSRNLENSEMIS